MFCSNCGENLVSPNQNFCQNCGQKILNTTNVASYKTTSIQSEPRPEVIYIPMESEQRIKKGIPGKNSKICLGLALGSLFLAILSIIIGYSYFRFFNYEFYNYMPRLVISITILLMRVGGLIMGAYSKFFSSRAVDLEPYNDAEKTGVILGIFGIIINSIGIYLSILGPFSILHLVYFYL
ncbi:MAG: zinc ribbon domain-containing protein [Promethearchaeota archaeon]